MNVASERIPADPDLDREKLFLHALDEVRPAPPAVESLRALPESAVTEIRFNVMPGRPVEERLQLREYRVGRRYIEASFDRHYHSSMDRSPSHLIFLTALVHTQKLLYALLCHELELPYDPEAKECLKIWPTKLHIHLPRMVRREKDIVQRLWITELVERKPGEHRVELFTRVEEQIAFSVECAVYRS